MTNRTFSIMMAVVCLALLPLVAAHGQTTVFVDNGTAATNYEGTGAVAGTTTGVAEIVVSADNTTAHAVINTAPATAGHAWTSVAGGLSAASSNGHSSLIVDNVSSFIGTSTSGLNIPDAGTSATLLVNSTTGIAHGLVINQNSTVLSGGTNSTNLTLDNTGATFSDNLGGPAVVHGVAPGIAPFDAVDVAQLDQRTTQLSSGIASVAALAAIPATSTNPCKPYVVGFGYGHYGGENAGAVGITGTIPRSGLAFRIGAGFSESSSPAYNAGVGFGF